MRGGLRVHGHQPGERHRRRPLLACDRGEDGVQRGAQVVGGGELVGVDSEQPPPARDPEASRPPREVGGRGQGLVRRQRPVARVVVDRVDEVEAERSAPQLDRLGRHRAHRLTSIPRQLVRSTRCRRSHPTAGSAPASVPRCRSCSPHCSSGVVRGARRAGHGRDRADRDVRRRLLRRGAVRRAQRARGRRRDGRRDRRRAADERPLAADGLRGRSVAPRRRPLPRPAEPGDRRRLVRHLQPRRRHVRPRPARRRDPPPGVVVDRRDGARRAVRQRAGRSGAPGPRRGLPGLLPVARRRGGTQPARRRGGARRGRDHGRADARRAGRRAVIAASAAALIGLRAR